VGKKREKESKKEEKNPGHLRQECRSSEHPMHITAASMLPKEKMTRSRNSRAQNTQSRQAHECATHERKKEDAHQMRGNERR